MPVASLSYFSRTIGAQRDIGRAMFNFTNSLVSLLFITLIAPAAVYAPTEDLNMPECAFGLNFLR